MRKTFILSPFDGGNGRTDATTLYAKDGEKVGEIR